MVRIADSDDEFSPRECGQEGGSASRADPGVVGTLVKLWAMRGALHVVRLLPAFDQWVVCASRRVGPRSRPRPGPGKPALDPLHRRWIYRLQGWVSPVLLLNGRIEGVRKHERKGRRLYVEVDTFRPLPRRARKPIEAGSGEPGRLPRRELELTLTSS
jgi:hypothetical protein